MNTITRTKPLNVLITDSSPSFLAALQHSVMTYPDFTLVDACQSATDLLQVLQKSEVDVLVLDFVIFGDVAAKEIKDIRAQFPRMKIIVLTIDEASKTKSEIIDAGVHGYYTKWENSRGLKSLISESTVF